MDATPFRTISIPSAPTAEASAQSSTQVEEKAAPAEVLPESTVKPGLNIYEEIEGKPYTADFFGLSAFLEDPSYSELHSEMYDVDQWVRAQIRDKGLTETQEAYAEIVAELEHSIGKYQNEQPLKHFQRVSAAVQAMNRLAAARVKPVLDMEHLTPTEYEMIVGAYRGR